MFSETLWNNQKVISIVFFHNATVTANLFEILKMLLAMYFTYRIK